MHRPSSRYYLHCQAIGWGGVAALLIISTILIHIKLRWSVLAGFIFPGLLCTHLLRNVIRHYHWLDLPLRRSLARILPAFLLALITAALIRSTFPNNPHFPHQFLPYIAEFNFVFFPWLLLYVGIHQIRYARENTKRIQRLEHLVKEQESADTGATIDPEDLTATLEHIRSLIDTDPNSARREITTFSRLLRSGHLKS
jgi:amino acid transporter